SGMCACLAGPVPLTSQGSRAHFVPWPSGAALASRRACGWGFDDDRQELAPGSCPAATRLAASPSFVAQQCVAEEESLVRRRVSAGPAPGNCSSLSRTGIIMTLTFPLYLLMS